MSANYVRTVNEQAIICRKLICCSFSPKIESHKEFLLTEFSLCTKFCVPSTYGQISDYTLDTVISDVIYSPYQDVY